MRIPLLLAVSLAVAGGGASAQQPIRQSVPTAATGGVEIQNTSGSVRVTGWDRNEIRITGTLGEGAERVAVESSGDRTQIRVVIPRGARNVRGTDLEIRLPSRKEVVVRATSADVGVSGVSGTVDARSTSGNVEVGGSPREVVAGSTSGDVVVRANTTRVRANTTSGNIQVEGEVRESVAAEAVSGDVTVTASTTELLARSVSGDLRLDGAGRRVAASTVSGDAQIRAGSIQYGSFETVSGDLSFHGDLQRDAAFNVQSHSGDVTLALPGGVSADFQVSTFSGNIRSDFGGQVQSAGRPGPGRELRFSSGGGEAVVSVKTFSGNVKLQRR